jgi:ligand-binding sensor domain-containing protein
MFAVLSGCFSSGSCAGLSDACPGHFLPRVVIAAFVRHQGGFVRAFRAGLLCPLTVALMVSGGAALALTPDASFSQYIHRSWHTADGLPAGAILALIQSSDGYLWIGTQEGLVRFDGFRFTVFDSTNTPEIHNSFITALCPSHGGGIWVGTLGGGLLRWDGGVFSLWTTVEGLPDMHIRCLLEDRSHALWIGTEGWPRRAEGRTHQSLQHARRPGGQ